MSNRAGLPQSPGPGGPELRLADKVAWLRERLGPGDEAIETHFAWVFLLGDRAWKLRKPVRRETMDYSTLEARHRDSAEETRLNRRLAPHVYLGTRPLTRDVHGRLAIGGGGTVVDWLVEMRRLDRSRMLDVQLERGGATDVVLRRVIALLAGFYAQEPAAVTDGNALAARLHALVANNHRVLQLLDPTAATALRDAQDAFVESRRDWLDARAARGCVIEAHGDLRPEHILLDDPPAVIDCLEFDRNLRVLDRAEELEFLALECERLGHAARGRWLVDQCLAQLGDSVPAALAQFYRSHRAATRAKLYVWRTNEPDGGTPAAWHATAREYLAMAQRAALHAASPAGTP